MLKLNHMIYLSILIALSLSCSQSEMDSKVQQESTEVTDFLSLNSTDTFNYTSGIRSILHDSKGNYWIGSHQEGVARFDGESFTYFTVEDGLSANQVRTIQEDDEGVIWFGTADGVSSFDGRNIEHHRVDWSREDAPELQDRYQIRTGDLWFNAGNKAGLYGVSDRKLKFEAFPVEIDGNSSYEFSYGVKGFSKTRLDYGWIATYSAVFGFDGETFKVIDDQSLAFYVGIGGDLHVRSILEDSKGNFWIGNNGIGVLLDNGNNIINFSDKHELIDPKTKGGDRSLPGTLEHVFAISEDTDGNIWFGDRDTGAWVYDGEVLTNFTVDQA